MARLVLLTGIPGVGKTTIATALPPPFYERVHFGALLRLVVEQRDRKALTHTAFREHFFRFLDSSVISEATVHARDQVARSNAKVCVLDSHAVTQTPSGLRATPDNDDRVELLPFDGIIHLSSAGCPSRVVENSTKDGRQRMTEVDVLVAEHLQLAVGVLYAAAHDCPLVIVSAVEEPKQILHRVDAAIRSLVSENNV